MDTRLVSLCSTSQGHLEFTTGFGGTWFLMIFVLPQHLFVTITTLNPSRDTQNTHIFQRADIFPKDPSCSLGFHSLERQVMNLKLKHPPKRDGKVGVWGGENK